MMDTEANQQLKQERSRTRWTTSLDKIFADLVVKQIQEGNRRNNVFDKKTWNHIRDEFNKETYLSFNNNQLRKHLDVLRQRFNVVKSAQEQNEFTIDDSCCIGFDMWEDIGVNPRSEAVKVKDCPIFDQLCTIFADTSADGKYAQSSHFEGLDRTIGNHNSEQLAYHDGVTACSDTPSASKPVQRKNSLPEKTNKSTSDRKRKRSSEARSSLGQSRMDDEAVEAMAEALSKMVAASKLRSITSRERDDKFSITNCIKALDSIEGIDEQDIYFAALDLFEEPNLRETFLSLKGDKLRLTWLQGKCSRLTNAM